MTIFDCLCCSSFHNPRPGYIIKNICSFLRVFFKSNLTTYHLRLVADPDHPVLTQLELVSLNSTRARTLRIYSWIVLPSNPGIGGNNRWMFWMNTFPGLVLSRDRDQADTAHTIFGLVWGREQEDIDKSLTTLLFHNSLRLLVGMFLDLWSWNIDGLLNWNLEASLWSSEDLSEAIRLAVETPLDKTHWTNKEECLRRPKTKGYAVVEQIATIGSNSDELIALINRIGNKTMSKQAANMIDNRENGDEYHGR